MEDLNLAVRRKMSFFQTFKAVGWAFFGVRRRAAHEQDVGQLNPLALIVVALICAALFIGILIAIVKLAIA